MYLCFFVCWEVKVPWFAVHVYHFYADETQLYITFKTDSADDACLAKSRVEHCAEEIDWQVDDFKQVKVEWW